LGKGETIAGEVEQSVSAAEDSTLVGVAEDVTTGDEVGAIAEDWIAADEETGAVEEAGTDEELTTPHDGRGATLSILDTTQEEASSV
jgi:hypothetical protein